MLEESLKTIHAGEVVEGTAVSYTHLDVYKRQIMKLLTTEKERKIKMGQLRPVSKLEKILFPIVVTIVVCLIPVSYTHLV